MFSCIATGEYQIIQFNMYIFGQLFYITIKTVIVCCVVYLNDLFLGIFIQWSLIYLDMSWTRIVLCRLRTGRKSKLYMTHEEA
jgi:hypothetical protein